MYVNTTLNSQDKYDMLQHVLPFPLFMPQSSTTVFIPRALKSIHISHAENDECLLSVFKIFTTNLRILCEVMSTLSPPLSISLSLSLSLPPLSLYFMSLMHTKYFIAHQIRVEEREAHKIYALNYAK